MGLTNRSTARTASGLRPATVILVGIAVAGSAQANPDLVEGVSVSGTETMRVDLGYRCEGQDCGFEAILHGVLPGDVTGYEWQFGEGETVTTTGPLVDYRWAEPGVQNVTLLVHDQYCDPLMADASLSILATDPMAGVEPLTAASVRLAQDATRVASEPLQGTTVSGDVFVFLEASELAESVTFRLLDSSLVGQVSHVDDASPFDMAGGALDSASPFDTRALANGAYRLDVSIVYPGAVEDAVSVAFDVYNAVNEPVAEGPDDGGVDEPPMGGATPDEPVDETPDGTPTDGGDVPADGGGETPTDGTTPEEPTAPTGETPDTTPTDGGGETPTDETVPEEPATPTEETPDTTPTDSGDAPADGGGETPTDGTTPEEPTAPTEETPDTTPTDGSGDPIGGGGETPIDGTTPEEPATPTEETPDTTPTGGDDASADGGEETPTDGTTPEEPTAPTEETPDTTPTDGGNAPTGDGGETPSGGTTPDGTDPDAVEPTGALVFSTKADRSGSDPLAGATVGGKIYVRLEGSDGVSSVRFFVDDPAQSGQPFSVDTSAPWDAAGGSHRRAKAIDTKHLGRGRHVLSAEVVESGITYTVHASFTVGR